MSTVTDSPIKEHVKKAYGSIATDGRSGCCSGSSVEQTVISKSIGYSESELESVPEGANLGLGCGNPTSIANLKADETVLDLGSGAGFDCFLAARQVGESGRIIGVDMTPEMIEKARANAKNGGFTNVEFRQGEIENLPVEDASIDVVLSNCVINLSPDKGPVFDEIFRVLKPGGRVMISDIALKKPLPEKILNSIEAYVGCVSGALLLDEYSNIVNASGLQNVRIDVNAVSSCAGSDSKDPIVRELLQQVDNPREFLDNVVSVYIQATKPAIS